MHIRLLPLLLITLFALASCDPASTEEEDDHGPNPWEEGITLEFDLIRPGDFVDIDIWQQHIVGLTQGGHIHISRNLHISAWETCAVTSEHTRTIALTGNMIFTGGTAARFSLFDLNCAFIRGGTINFSASGPLNQFDISDAYFLGSSVFVALAQADDLDGALVQGAIPGSIDQSIGWTDWRPQTQPTSYRSIMLEVSTVAGIHTRSASQTTTMPGLIRGAGTTWNSIGLAEKFMGQVPFRMARYTNQQGSLGLFLVDLSGPIIGNHDHGLFISRTVTNPLFVHDVEIVGFSLGGVIEGVPRAVKVDEFGHVWLAGDLGLFRSRTSLPNATPPW